MGVRETFSKRKAEMKAQVESSALVVLDNRCKQAEKYKRDTVAGLVKVVAITGGKDHNTRYEGYQAGKQIEIKQALQAGIAIK